MPGYSNLYADLHFCFSSSTVFIHCRPSSSFLSQMISPINSSSLSVCLTVNDFLNQLHQVSLKLLQGASSKCGSTPSGKNSPVISCILLPLTFSYLPHTFQHILGHWLSEPQNSPSFMSHCLKAWCSHIISYVWYLARAHWLL